MTFVYCFSLKICIELAHYKNIVLVYNPCNRENQFNSIQFSIRWYGGMPPDGELD